MGSIRFKLAIASLGVVLAVPIGAIAQTTQTDQNGGPQVAQPESGGVNWKGAGIGAATLLANVGYIPAKTVYAILGGITGGAGYALTGGNQQTANAIWRSSLGGDYVLTPEMLRGQAPVHFSGPPVPPEQNTVPPPVQPLSANPPPSVTASTAPVYPSTPSYSSSSTPSTSPPAGVGAPPVSMPSHSGYSSSHFTTSITGPGDSGTGPVHEHDIE
ncbi:MAG TPA: hypothetical protein VKB84_08125 [Candidatus Binataceae bacterium]|jgi:hypothetical protein|nr:hypothetical protein [Candidatus Binataceae bacterium]